MARKTKAPEPQEPVIQVTGRGFKHIKGKGKVETEIAFPPVSTTLLDTFIDRGPGPWLEHIAKDEEAWGTPYRLVAKLHTFVPVWNGAMWVQIPQAHELWSWDKWRSHAQVTEDSWTVHPYDSNHKKRKAVSAPMPLEEALGLIDFLRTDRGGEFWIFPAV